VSDNYWIGDCSFCGGKSNMQWVIPHRNLTHAGVCPSPMGTSHRVECCYPCSDLVDVEAVPLRCPWCFPLTPEEFTAVVLYAARRGQPRPPGRHHAP
jgi:hypothetical protein